MCLGLLDWPNPCTDSLGARAGLSAPSAGIHRPSPQAAAKLWPEVFATPEADARKEELVEKMRVVRPVVETG